MICLPKTDASWVDKHDQVYISGIRKLGIEDEEVEKKLFLNAMVD